MCEALFEECWKLVDNWRSLEIGDCWVTRFDSVCLQRRFASLEGLSICFFHSSELYQLLADTPRAEGNHSSMCLAAAVRPPTILVTNTLFLTQQRFPRRSPVI